MVTDDHGAGARVKAELLEYRQTVGGGGYPAELRERACRCARTMRARGLDISHIAAELGVTAATASVWSRDRVCSKDAGEALSFVPVVVEGQQEQRFGGSGRFEISFPTGAVLCVDGVDVETVTAAITALTRGQS